MCAVVSATIPVALFPGSHPKQEREPGNIGGVKPWTSSGWVLAVPIRLQNDSCDKFAATASDVATPLRCDHAKKPL